MAARKDTKLPENAKGTCLSRIRSIAATSKNSAGPISEFVLARPDEVLELTLAELSQKAGTSVASVSRFCNMLGYENYRAFQIDLTASLAANISPISDVFSPSDDPSTVIRRVFEFNRQGLADTAALLHDDTVIAVAKLIMKSRRLWIVGIGGSGLAARSGALRLRGLGVTALAITDPYEGLLTLSSAASDDVVIAISHTGRTGVVVDMLELAKKKGVQTVGITNYADSIVARESDFTLLTSYRERRINAAVSSSSIAQMCVLDAIYFLLAYFQGPRAEELAIEIEKAAEESLRAKP